MRTALKFLFVLSLTAATACRLVMRSEEATGGAEHAAAPAAAPTSRRSARPARTSCGCRRRSRSWTRCSRWPRSHRRTS